MEALIEQLWGFVQQYGAEVALVAFATIFVVGVIKVIFKKGFESINTNVKKAIYEILSVILCYGLTALWMYAKVQWIHISIEPFDWQLVLKAASATLVAVKVMYPVYENFGIRALLRLIGNFILSWFKKKDKKVENESNSNNVINL